MKKIDESIVVSIMSDLNKMGKGLWLKLDNELQDNSSFLLVRIEVPRYTDEDIIYLICDLLREVIGPKIPPREDEYSWMGNIYIDDKLVESVTSEIKR